MTDEDKALVKRLRDDDSYYRVQEKHWCIDHEELERQRLAAADLIETQAREIERLRGAISAALRCTPQAKHGTIIYDCGDPWEILTAALTGDSHD